MFKLSLIAIFLIASNSIVFSGQLNDQPRFRKICASLSVNDVKKMLKNNRLFDNRWNPTGKFVNSFETTYRNNTKLIIDTESSLMWTTAFPKKLSFNHANKELRVLNSNSYGGFSDWRIPTLVELSTLLNRVAEDGNSCQLRGAMRGQNEFLCIDSSFDVENEFIWSCDTRKGDSGNAWAVMFKSNVPQHYSRWRNASIILVRTL